MIHVLGFNTIKYYYAQTVKPPFLYLKLSVLASVHGWGGWESLYSNIFPGIPAGGLNAKHYNLSSLEFVYMNTYSDISLPTDIKTFRILIATSTDTNKRRQET